MQNATVASKDALYQHLRGVIPPFDWPGFADDIDAVLALKHERNAVILAHSYQTPGMARP
jgi:quinolinate synthase